MNQVSIMSLSRRIVAGLLTSALVGITAVQAAAPVTETQVPGYYRQQVGNAVVAAVYDGYVSLDPKSLPGLDQQQIQRNIARMFQAKTPASRLPSTPSSSRSTRTWS